MTVSIHVNLYNIYFKYINMHEDGLGFRIHIVMRLWSMCTVNQFEQQDCLWAWPYTVTHIYKSELVSLRWYMGSFWVPLMISFLKSNWNEYKTTYMTGPTIRKNYTMNYSVSIVKLIRSVQNYERDLRLMSLMN